MYDYVSNDADEPGRTYHQWKLVVENRPLVFSVIRKCYYMSAQNKDTMDEMISAGYVGLVRAARGFDPAKATFGTYAYTAIRREIYAYLTYHSKLRAHGKKCRENTVVPHDLTREDDPIDPRSLESTLYNESIEELRKLFDKRIVRHLTPSRVKALRLKMKGYTCSQAAEIMGISKSAVAKHVQDALHIAKGLNYVA